MASASLETVEENDVTPIERRVRARLDTLADVRREMAKLYRMAHAETLDVQDAARLASFLASRLKKLERQRRKPKVRHTIAEFDPVTGRNIGSPPLSRCIMRITSWGYDENWAQALLKQQTCLKAHA
jgi:hypothetical protein